MPKQRKTKWLVGLGLSEQSVGPRWYCPHFLWMLAGQPASRVETGVRISHLLGPEDRFTFCALQISMPKARESHFKNQTAFSFHMQKRDEKCKLQTIALRWETFTENKTQTNSITIFCKVLFFPILLFSVFNKIASKAKTN